MEYGYLFYIVFGFLSGSILFGRIIPYLFKNIDVTKESDDGNPGVFNAFACGGPVCGILALVMDLLKGALPVVLCVSYIGTDSWLFALVLAAPVLGHAHSAFNRGKGGKGIAVSFGVLIGLLPVWQPLALLIVWYLLFLMIIPGKSNTRKSIYAFLAFGISAVFVVKYKMIRYGCMLISGVVIHKHYLSAIACEQSQEEIYEKSKEGGIR